MASITQGRVPPRPRPGWSRALHLVGTNGRLGQPSLPNLFHNISSGRSFYKSDCRIGFSVFREPVSFAQAGSTRSRMREARPTITLQISWFMRGSNTLGIRLRPQQRTRPPASRTPPRGDRIENKVSAEIPSTGGRAQAGVGLTSDLLKQSVDPENSG